MKTNEKEKNKNRFTYTDEEYSKLSTRERRLDKRNQLGYIEREVKKRLNTEEDGKKPLQNVFTPFEIGRKMIDSLGGTEGLKGKKILVMNLEILILLIHKRYGYGLNNDDLYFLSDSQAKRNFIRKAFKQNQILNVKKSRNKGNKIEIINEDEDMKFDAIIMNPPYNPNSMWKDFVLKGVELLNQDGKMVVIHPDSWSYSSKYKKIRKQIIEHSSEIHIAGFDVFDNVGVSVDWYVYNKQKQDNLKVYYNNGDIDEYNKEEKSTLKYVHKFSRNSMAYTIMKKITKENYNNKIIILKGWDDLYKQYSENGKYKQCGGLGRGTSWTRGDFHLTDKPTEHQFENKVVMSYCGRPRAEYFSKEDEVGVCRASYWLTDNTSLPILLNSKMFWKILTTFSGVEGLRNPWNKLLESLNFENLNVKTEEELYEHYGLTKEEIEWIESE